MNDQMTGLVGELVSDKISIKDALKNGLGMEQLPQEVPPETVLKGVKEALIDSKVVDREAEALSAADQAAATEVRPSQQDEEVAVHAKEVAHQLHTMNTHRRELALIVEAAGITMNSVQRVEGMERILMNRNLWIMDSIVNKRGGNVLVTALQGKGEETPEEIALSQGRAGLKVPLRIEGIGLMNVMWNATLNAIGIQIASLVIKKVCGV